MAVAKIIQIADIHIRDTCRDKFDIAIKNLSSYLIEKIANDGIPIIAVIAGDIFHYKTRLSAENITDYYTLLDCLAMRAKYIVIIPGNHDANLNNDERIDLLTPLISNCRQLPNGAQLYYWARSGWQTLSAAIPISFYVFSPLSQAVAPTQEPENAIPHVRVALVHDFIDGMKMQGSVIRSSIKRDWLAQFDMVICGHVHDYTRVDNTNIVYCGALTQLTIAESYDKGFVLWQIDGGAKFKINHKFVCLEIPCGMVKYTIAPPAPFRVQHNCILERQDGIPADASRVVVELKQGVQTSHADVIAILGRIAARVPNVKIEIAMPADNVSADISQATSGVQVGIDESVLQLQNKLIEEKLRADNVRINDETIQAVQKMHTDIIKQLSMNSDSSMPFISTIKWQPLYLSWSNLFCYGAQNYINFTEVSGIAGLIAPNRRGKSSIIDILVLALFNTTLRGSAYTIIRKHCREGSLKCAWKSNGHTYEITRQWDLRGHTTILYTIDGVNNTGMDLKTTYDHIARSVGTFEDFLHAVLIPQHAESSFLDATDAKQRGIITRILGLDILDNALNCAKEKEHEYQAMISSTETITNSLLARIASSQHCMRIAGGDLFDSKTGIMSDIVKTKYAELVKDARDITMAAQARLEELEAKPAIAKPRATIKEINNEIATLTTTITILESELSAKEAILKDKRALCESIEAPLQEISYESIGCLRAQIDQSALILGHAQGTRIVNLQETINTKMKKLQVQLEVKQLLGAISALGTISAIPNTDAQIASIITILDKYNHNANDIEHAIKTLRASVHVQNVRKCTCGNDTARASEFRAKFNSLECALFASSIQIPSTIPTEEECGKRIATLLAQLQRDSATKALTAREIAYCAIQIVRSVSYTQQSRAQIEEEFARVKSCVESHDEIMRNNKILEEIDRLSCALNYLKHAQRASYLDRINGSKLFRENIKITTHFEPIIRDLNEAIFKMERTIASLEELRAKETQIRTALAQEAKVCAMQAQYDKQNTLKREQLHIDRIANEIEITRAKLEAARAKCATVRNSAQTIAVEETAYNAFLECQKEIVKIRNAYSRANASYVSIESEARTYENMRGEWVAVGEKLKSIHELLHICRLYKGALDTKTGIQYKLMVNSIGLIEGEVNRLLNPIAGLNVSFGLGCGKLTTHAITNSVDGTLCKTGAQGSVMQITVQDKQHDIEHSVELCSGFQRFILNVAFRRAFLRCAVRPMPRFMIIDEGFGCIDEPNMAKICEYLPDLSRELDFMLIVSHIDTLNTLITMPLNIDISSIDSSSIHHGAPPESAPSPIRPQEMRKQKGQKGQKKKVAATDGAGTSASAERQQVSATDSSLVDVRADGTLYCKVCNKDVKDWAKHRNSSPHLKKCPIVAKR